MAFKEIPNTAKAIVNLSEDFGGKKELLDVLPELVDAAVTLQGRALKLHIEKDKMYANFTRFKTKVERLLKNYEKDRSKANLKQRVTYNTRLLQQVKELAGPLNAFANEIYAVASRASTSHFVTCGKGILVIGGILAAIFFFFLKVALLSCALTGVAGVGMLLHQAYNSFYCNSTENELRRLAADTQKFLLEFDELLSNLEDRNTELEAEKQRDC